MGASLLAKAVGQPTFMATDPPPSRAGSLPQWVLCWAWNQRPASVSLFTQILAHPLGRQPPGHAVYPTARMNAGTP
ncbi:MAG: hypothetical protein C0411_19725 [Pseudomonas sp.]|nr:hypothetical protein [Pseudomonas sp.]